MNIVYHLVLTLALLIDCGLFQGEEKGCKSLEKLEIDFDIQHVSALIVTHVQLLSQQLRVARKRMANGEKKR